MKRICVNKEGVGSCIVDSKKEIPIANEFAIKSLSSIQLLLLENDARTNQDIKEVINILHKCSEEISQVYKGMNTNGSEY